jgi:hypothetical protein
MNQNSIREEIKNRSRSGNACYYVVQNLCLQVCCPKIQRLRYTELEYCLLLCMGVKLGH